VSIRDADVVEPHPVDCSPVDSPRDGYERTIALNADEADRAYQRLAAVKGGA
jgi:hypothetical protein